MDFTKRGLQKKHASIKSIPEKLSSKVKVFLFRLTIALAVFIMVVGVYSGLGFAKGLIDSAPDISQINVLPQGYRTTMYDIDGNVMQTLIGAHSNRVYVTIDEIPLTIQKSFLAIEDERFYEHDGIDVRGVFRALFSGISKGDFDQGASTITQQLLKNQVFEGGTETNFVDKMERKIQEQYLAIQLEDILEKDLILEYYLNTINLSSGTYGVQTAARRYFNKDVGDLNLSESAVIAAITQSPVYRNPINYPESNAERRKHILDKMFDLGWCSDEEYKLAINDDVYSRILSINDEIDTSSYYSYFVDATIDQVLNDLQTEKGYTQAQASQLLYSGGLEIYTTQDPTIQEICNDVYSDEEFFPKMGVSYWELTYALSVERKDGTTNHYHGDDLLAFHREFKDPLNLYIHENGSRFSLLFLDKEDMQERIKEFRESIVEYGDTVLGEVITMTIQPQSSFVVMDYRKGNVAAIVGGRGSKEGNRTLNRASNTFRQPGSTFKVVSTYLPALDSAGLTLASTQNDAPYNYPGTERPIKNWRSGAKQYQGLSTLRKGIWDSMNIVTVKTLEQVTPQIAYEYLLKLGFTSLVDSRVETNGTVVSDINYSMGLGGLTDGVSNLELTAAYAAIANEGVYNKPRLYERVIGHDGQVILDNVTESDQVMKKTTAFLLTNAMEDTVKIGTGRAYKLANNMPVAGKTGTTSSNYDLWFSGYSPHYVSTIWSGFDNNRSQSDKDYQKNIWRTIMDRIHKDLELEAREFPIPDSIVKAKICTKSGKLAVDGLCDKSITGDDTLTEYFANDNVPTENCDSHVRAFYCTEGKALAGDYCPAESVEERIFLIKGDSDETLDSETALPSKTCTLHNLDSFLEDEDSLIGSEEDAETPVPTS